jgi:hypothetical protein
MNTIQEPIYSTIHDQAEQLPNLMTVIASSMPGRWLLNMKSSDRTGSYLACISLTLLSTPISSRTKHFRKAQTLFISGVNMAEDITSALVSFVTTIIHSLPYSGKYSCVTSHGEFKSYNVLQVEPPLVV